MKLMIHELYKTERNGMKNSYICASKMNTKTNLVLFIVFSSSYIFIYYTLFIYSPNINLSNKIKNPRHSLLLDTVGCKIPKLDPFDVNIKKYFLSKGKRLECAYKHDILYTDGNKIKINRNSLARRLKLKNCRYKVIWRPTNIATDHNYFILGNQSEPFKDNQVINDDFIKVTCFNDKNISVYRNAFSFIHKKAAVERRCMEVFKQFKNSSDFINVLMIGIDSVSRSNMIRYMSKSREYLRKEMDALEYVGYNKVADNTFLNIVPMTAGKFVHELPWNATMTEETFDKFEFIWKKFSENGYRTLYSEDAPNGQVFDYEKAGFSKPIADYFDRHYSVVLEHMKDVWNTDHQCVHARPETKIKLDYTKQFVKTFANSPFFSFTFNTRLTHDILENAYAADELYLNFFKDIHEGSYLKNTFLIFFSDHGIRFGNFRQTHIGKMEERLPFLFIVVPQWFKYKYTNFYNSLKKNTERLVTPFDIYETLVHLLNITKYKDDSFGRSQSLFSSIPTERTCAQAGILPHWCTCLNEETVLDLKNKFVKQIAKSFVESINKQLHNYTQCNRLELKTVRAATKFLPSDYILKYIKTSHMRHKSEIKFGKRVQANVHYQIVIQTTPGDGIFEVTMEYSEASRSIKRVGDISRINMYGKTSHCVEGIDLKKICYCKGQI